MSKMSFSTLLFFSAVLFFQSSSWALFTIQESTDITPVGHYKLGLEPQVKTSDGGGTNFTAFFDTGISDETSARVLVGTGDTDFAAGASFKWVPIPDYKKQPAIGGKVSLLTWHDSGDSFSALRLEPIVGKKFETDIGSFSPYASVPVMFIDGKTDSKTGFQLAGGTEYIHHELENMTFGGEIGFNAKSSFSYISAFVTINVDDLYNKGK
ncbi:MAG: hypothetical protein COT73_10135 [Bdellovibrio sp. CG10_big_fil_rev_8_21_14_0_10_47_8]|nr:MAG: hypothetical protein COT73_10135 [Bdellovibrio sp. CG10_big_fil_rev_8_21_14_0_10_47_8]